MGFLNGGAVRRARYLAPWRRGPLLDGEGGDSFEEIAHALAALEGTPAIYHCVSRVVERRKAFGAREKEEFVRLMRLYERYCQVKVLAFVVMSNHFHILVEIPERPVEDMDDEALLRHLKLLERPEEVQEVAWTLQHYRSIGASDAAEELRERYFARMFDLSAFMKALKQRFTQWFNRNHERSGTLWEARFRSVLVESGHAARVVAAYIELNPVRAGLVWDPRDYRWCSYGEAVAGKRKARLGIQRVLFDLLNEPGRSKNASAGEVGAWRRVHASYRQFLYDDGKKSEGEGTGGTRKAGVRTFTKEQVETVRRRGGRLSEREMLVIRTRHFTEGLAIGSKKFLNQAFQLSRQFFSERRSDGARPIRWVDSPIHGMRDLGEP